MNPCMLQVFFSTQFLLIGYRILRFFARRIVCRIGRPAYDIELTWLNFACCFSLSS